MLSQSEYDAVMQAIEQSMYRAQIVMNMLTEGEQLEQFKARHSALEGAKAKLPTMGVVEKPKRRYTRKPRSAA